MFFIHTGFLFVLTWSLWSLDLNIIWNRKTNSEQKTELKKKKRKWEICVGRFPQSGPTHSHSRSPTSPPGADRWATGVSRSPVPTYSLADVVGPTCQTFNHSRGSLDHCLWTHMVRTFSLSSWQQISPNHVGCLGPNLAIIPPSVPHPGFKGWASLPPSSSNWAKHTVSRAPSPTQTPMVTIASRTHLTVESTLITGCGSKPGDYGSSCTDWTNPKSFCAQGIAHRSSVSVAMPLLIDDIATDTQFLGKKPSPSLVVVRYTCRIPRYSI
jgi:hypothetical protein